MKQQAGERSILTGNSMLADSNSPAVPISPASATYVPGHEYDVFVSYARDNDETDPGDDTSGWVTRLKLQVERLVNGQLEVDGRIRVFFDSGTIAPNAPLTATIAKAAQHSAILLVVLSPRYLNRPWCIQERELFVKAAGGVTLATPRIFLVHFDEVPLERYPAEFRELIGIEFYYKHPVEGWTAELRDDDTVRDELKVTYNERLRKLRHHLATTLNQMRRKAISVPPLVDRPAVFLAEPTDRVSRKLRQEIELTLETCFRVLPLKNYDRAPDAYQAALDDDLRQAVLFVQVLGEAGTVVRTDNLPQGYEGLQLERARAAKKPCLRWRPRNLPMEEIEKEDPDYFQFITAAGVEAGEIAEFKKQIEDVVARLTAKRPDVPDTVASGQRLLLAAREPDQTFAEEVGKAIEKQAVLADMANPKDTVLAIESGYEQQLKVSHDGFMVVYDVHEKDSAAWVLERFEEFRAIALRRKVRKPVFAVYLGPKQPPLNGRPAFVKVIDHSNDAALQQFIGEVVAKGAGAG
jgi:TIR domain-containing protein